MSEWREVKGESNVFTFDTDKNKELIGILLEIRKGKFGNNVYGIEKSNKEIVIVFGTTFLDNRITEDMIGETIKIVYNGEIKTSTGRIAKDFSVFINE